MSAGDRACLADLGRWLDRQLAVPAERGFGTELLLVPYPAPGQRVEEVWGTLGMRGTRSNNLILEDCVVPAENYLGSTNFLMWFESLPQWGFGSYTAVYRLPFNRRQAIPASLGLGCWSWD